MYILKVFTNFVIQKRSLIYYKKYYVLVPPEIQEPIEGTASVVNVGSYLTLKCDVFASPKAVVKWYKGNIYYSIIFHLYNA